MLKQRHVTLLAALALVLILGCGAPGVKRAPIDEIPEEVDTETRIEMLEEMAAAYPEDAYVPYEMGNIYYDELMPGDAAASYEKALALDPKMNKARVNLAMVLAESDEVDSAKVLLEEAIAIDPADTKAYNNLGMIYYTELDVNNAVKYFTKALELDPEDYEARYNLGLSFAEQGLLLEAIREWRYIVDSSEGRLEASLEETEPVEEDETVQRARLSLERAERELQVGR